MGTWLTLLVILFTLLVVSYLTATKTDFFEDYIFVPWRRMGWRRPHWAWSPWAPHRRWPFERVSYITYVEPFADAEGAPLNEKKEDMRNVAYPELYNNTPYHLLGDEMAPATATPERISCVNSRNCYATSFDRFIEQTGNFRQMTNNYKRGYPDSCSAPFQELVLSFYKAEPMKMERPTNCL